MEWWSVGEEEGRVPGDVSESQELELMFLTFFLLAPLSLTTPTLEVKVATGIFHVTWKTDLSWLQFIVLKNWGYLPNQTEDNLPSLVQIFKIVKENKVT